MNRRDFLSFSSALCLASQARIGWAQPSMGPGEQRLVCIFLRGGADGLEWVVPHGEGAYYDARPTLALGEADGLIDLDGFFGLHPALEPLHSMYEAKDLGFVHAAGIPHSSRSHFDSQDYLEKGGLQQDLSDGWLNRHLQLQGSAESPLHAVAVGQVLPTSLRGIAETTAIGSTDHFGIVAPPDELAPFREMLLDLHYRQGALERTALSTIAASDLLEAADPGGIAPAAEYPAGDFSAAMQSTAQLFKADLQVRYACVDFGGWDHHERAKEQSEAMLREFSESMRAFHKDLGVLAGQTTVVVMTEFGRRVAENASRGTDHGQGSLLVVSGAGVEGGQVISEWPGLAADQLEFGDLRSTIDTRQVLTEILDSRFGGTDSAFVFPGMGAPMRVGAVS